MKKRVILISSLIILALVSFYFDAQIVQKVSLLRNYLFDEFFIGITFVSSEIIILFFLTSLFLWSEHKRKWILPLWATLFLSVIVSFIMKISFHRLRPFQLGIVDVLPLLEKTSHTVWNFSFPSFQSMLAFCAVPLLAKEFPKFKYVWIVFAILVAFSRVYFGLHFLSDVITGATIGLLLGFWVIYLKEKIK